MGLSSTRRLYCIRSRLSLLPVGLISIRGWNEGNLAPSAIITTIFSSGVLYTKSLNI